MGSFEKGPGLKELASRKDRKNSGGKKADWMERRIEGRESGVGLGAREDGRCGR